MKDFKAFLLRGNVIDLAVGIVIGAAFGAIVTSLVKDIIMPPVGLLLGNVDFANMTLLLQNGTPPGPYPSLAEAQKAGAVTINYGLFIMAVISFLIIAAVVFFFVVRPIARMTRPKTAPVPAAPTQKDCPYCYTAIPVKATRCPHCTAEIKTA
jgi:large conductance mechanosensitive channel